MGENGNRDVDKNENVDEVLDWEWVGMEIRIIPREWKEMGTTMVIPIHFYTMFQKKTSTHIIGYNSCDKFYKVDTLVR